MFEPVPQVLRSVRFAGAPPLDRPEVAAAIEDARARLGTGGRLLVRKSGTEPVVRVMAEGDDGDLVRGVVDGVCDALAAAAAGREAAE